MKTIPKTEEALVLRTDFSDDAAWEAICAAILQPVGQFRAYVNFISDPDYDGLTIQQLLAWNPQDSDHTFIFIVDHITLSHPEHPILVIDLVDDPGRTFRVIPSEMWAVENNLSLANLDFSDFANSTDPDGVFRGLSGN